MKHTNDDILKKRFGLNGKRGIVTGGSSGLGRSIAETLAAAGAEVFIFSRTGEFKLPAKKIPEKINHLKVDVTKRKECKLAVDKIGYNGLDFLINNAGITVRHKSHSVNAELWRNIQSVNVDAVYMLCQLAYKYLKKSPGVGRIVNISSMAAHLGFKEVVPYVTSKTAVLGLTRGLGVEWAQDNILVNSVSPGWFKTDMVKNLLDPEREKKILGRMPLHRYGEPEELANVVLFLVSPAASYITGQDFAVDGGALAFGY